MFMFPKPDCDSDDCHKYLMYLMVHFAVLAIPDKGRFWERVCETKKSYFLDLAVEIEGVSESFVKKFWTDFMEIPEKAGYRFYELNENEELKMGDWGESYISFTDTTEYSGGGPSRLIAEGGWRKA